MRFCVPIAAVVLSVLALGCSDAEPRSFELSPSSTAGDTPAATATVPGPPSMPAPSSTSIVVTTPTPMVSTPAPPPAVCEAFPRPSRELVPDSVDALQSQLAIDVLRPLLPHFIRGLVTSSGEAVDIAIGAPQSRQPGSTALEIDPVSLFPDMTADDQLPARVQTFREAAAAAFAWITSQGVCVGDLYVYWRSGGGGTGAQSDVFQLWLIPSDRFPEVACATGSCSFVAPPAGTNAPEDAVFQASGMAASNWRGECTPLDGTGLMIYEACYRLQERRGDTIRYAVMINQPPNRGGPRLDTFIIYVRLVAGTWRQVGGGLCSGECPWPN